MPKENYNKVAKITLVFWIMKIVATTLGETLGDYISMTLNLGYLLGLTITALFFFGVLVSQLVSNKYTPFIYWSVIVGTTTLGTEISDFIDRSLHLGYAMGSVFLITCLSVTLSLWFKKYKNLEVFPIVEKPKELYYWVALLFSNSLGTAFGDFISDNLGFSYLIGAMITGSIILIVILLHYYSKINHILLFWIAFVFTRPFGATFGDFLTKPLTKGGLELGTLQSSLVSIVIMVVLIYFSHKQKQTALK